MTNCGVVVWYATKHTNTACHILTTTTITIFINKVKCKDKCIKPTNHSNDHVYSEEHMQHVDSIQANNLQCTISTRSVWRFHSIRLLFLRLMQENKSWWFFFWTVTQCIHQTDIKELSRTRFLLCTQYFNRPDKHSTGVQLTMIMS